MHDRTAPIHITTAALCSAALLATCCQQPLPPEEPATQVDQPAEPVPIEVSSTQDPPPPAAPEPMSPGKLVFKDVGLQTPESVLYHEPSDTYFVSNINGSPVDVDNNGFISQLSPDGSVKNLKFIVGGSNGAELSAPKGMLIVDDTLLVTDINHVRRFDLKSGAPKPSWSFPQATFLNELTVDERGTIFVSDSGLKMGADGLETNGTDALYKVVDGKVSVLAKSTTLNGPNGIATHANGLVVVTFGANTLTHYDANGEPGQQVQLPTGGLDGVVPLADGTFLVSSWQGQAVYRGNFETPFATVVSDVTSPADIGFDTKRQHILIPLFLANEVWAVPLSNTAKSPQAPAVKSAAEAPAEKSPQAPAAEPSASAASKPGSAATPATPKQ